MPRNRHLVSWLLTVCTAIAVALGIVPAASAAQPAAGAGGVVAHAEQHDGEPLVVDKVAPGAAHRRASHAWKGRTLKYYETIPAKWDWSLSTAVSKWNSAGGGIRFVRTTKRRKAQLTIGYGSTGAAAGTATVGKTRRAFVRLSPRYKNIDALDAFYRIQVMGVFTHELGHVLGFGHTSATCSLMSPILDVDGCGVLSSDLTGYYKCRTVDAALAARFVRLYGGRTRAPGTWCLIDKLPSALGGVAFSTGTTAPVSVQWARPTYVPAGSRMVVRSWETDVCDTPPDFAATEYRPVTDGVWEGAPSAVVASEEEPVTPEGASGTVLAAPLSTCVSVQLVNRYGAGRAAVVGVVPAPVPVPAPAP